MISLRFSMALRVLPAHSERVFTIVRTNKSNP